MGQDYLELDVVAYTYIENQYLHVDSEAEQVRDTGQH